MVNEYLRSFFRALENLKRPKSYDVSHAIAYQDESLCILLSTGDYRVRVLVQELNPDPVKAAANVMTHWKSMSRDEVDMALQR